MQIRTFHRILGITMTLPFFAWAVTGFIFFLKPGYTDAYEMLSPKAYPIKEALSVPSDSTWLEVRYMKTILGNHLMVRNDQGWSHLNPATLLPAPPPGEEQIKLLLEDAFSRHPERYGAIVSVDAENGMTTTDTGVRITLNWNRLSLYQRGEDTDRIDMFYRIHYLQWTGIQTVDRVLGMLGLLFVLILTALGVRLFLKK